ncbi:hypothetical protein L596_021013 [Steinernema carpocapsae]|uniref:Uncharacterized protein n=1 Tax=Steinernema carpocapsae TaxID=34508 RepID=A0A4V6A1A7_STECR|nr:hypothetical protein L596_021013 [Steinernema carpocapsae]
MWIRCGISVAMAIIAWSVITQELSQPTFGLYVNPFGQRRFFQEYIHFLGRKTVNKAPKSSHGVHSSTIVYKYPYSLGVVGFGKRSGC